MMASYVASYLTFPPALIEKMKLQLALKNWEQVLGVHIDERCGLRSHDTHMMYAWIAVLLKGVIIMKAK